MKFQSLPTNCDCSAVTLEEASRLTGPAFVYDLYVSPAQLLSSRSMLRNMGFAVAGNVLAPYINLYADPDLELYSWYLSANGKQVGSRGGP